MTQPTTQAEYFQANAVDGDLTAAQMMELVQLPEGDIASVPTVAKDSAPDAVSDAKQVDDTTDTQSQTAADAQPQVILAKDGVHTIPYQKLVEARDGEKHWKAQAEAVQQQLAELQSQADQRAAAGQAPTTADAAVAQATAALDAGVDPALFGDFSEEAIANGVQKLAEKLVDARMAAMEAKLAEVVKPLQAKAQVTEAEKHFQAIYQAHPDADSLAESAELKAWINTYPSFVRQGFEAVLVQGTTTQVIELLDAFKASSKPVTDQKVVAEDAAAKAIANAKTRTPSSLSDIPGGVAPPTNPGEGLADASAQDLISKFEGLSEKARWELIEKIS